MSLNFTVIVWLRLSIGGVYVLAFCRSSLKSKKYFIILLALAAIAGLGTHAAWSSNGLPRIDNKTLARLAQQHRLSFCFAMLNVAIVQPINACQIKQVLRLKVPRMPVNWATLLALTSLISIFIPVIPSGPFSRRPGFPRVKS